MATKISYAQLPDKIRQKSSFIVCSDLVWTWSALFALLFLIRLSSSGFETAFWLVLIGTHQYHLNILGHDGIHSNLFASRKWNDWVTTWLVLGPQGIPMGGMRASHLHHHRTVGAAEDHDRHYYDLERYGRTSILGFAKWLVGTFVGAMILPLVKKILSGSRGTNTSSTDLTALIPVALSQGILFLACWFIVGSLWAYFACWILPLFTVMFGLNSVRSCLEHVCTTHPVTRHFSIRSNVVERFFLAPFNMNYHAEHHDFISVPYYRLPLLRRYLQENSLYEGIHLRSSYFATIVDTFQHLRKGTLDPAYRT